MKLNFITLMVRDIEKSVAFYQQLAGLEVLNRLSLSTGEIVFLANRNGETMLELAQFDGGEKVSTKGMFICFSAGEKLVELRGKAVKLGYFPSEIIVGGPAPNHFTISDRDGITVEFCV
jgi:lactoylglutathione lyase